MICKDFEYPSRAARRKLWLSLRRTVTGSLSINPGLLVAQDVQNLWRVCEEVCTMPKVCPDSPSASWNVATSHMPLALRRVGIGYGRNFAYSPQRIQAPNNRYRLLHKVGEVEPLIHITAGEVRKIIWRNIISRFGVPYAIISDNGTQFLGKAIQALCKKHNITIIQLNCGLSTRERASRGI